MTGDDKFWLFFGCIFGGWLFGIALGLMAGAALDSPRGFAFGVGFGLLSGLIFAAYRLGIRQ